MKKTAITNIFVYEYGVSALLLVLEVQPSVVRQLLI